MSTFPLLQNTLKARLFGQKVEYVCDMPLEDCLEQLQSKSERGSGIFASGYQVLITIIYEGRDDYSFIMERSIYWGKNRRHLHLGGKLQAIDAWRTYVTVDSTDHFSQGLVRLLMCAIPFYQIGFFVYAAFQLWGGPSSLSWICVGVAGLVVSAFFFADCLDAERRLWRDLAVYAFWALPPS